jgi:hypothetical protein
LNGINDQKIKNEYDMSIICTNNTDFLSFLNKNKNKNKNNQNKNIIEYQVQILENIDLLIHKLINGGFLLLFIQDITLDDKKIELTLPILDYIASKSNMRYFNILKYRGNTENTRIHPLFIFQKIDPLNYSIVNKEYFIRPVKQNNKTYHIIREDLLIGGSKQRMLFNVIKELPQKNIFYRGPVNGYSQLALSYICYLLEKTANIILNKQWNDQLYIVSKLTKLFRGNIILIDQLPETVTEDQAVNNIVSRYNDSLLLSQGFHTEEYMNENKKALVTLKNQIGDPARFWIVTSSGTILQTLLDIFLQTQFLVVFVGHIRDELKQHSRITWYQAPEKFRSPAKVIPPYPSEITYDAKVWQFVEKYGEDGDYVYNVGGLC